MLKHWTKNPFCPRGARQRWATGSVKENEVPPAVAAARRKLGWGESTCRERSRTPDTPANSCTVLQTVRGQNVVKERDRAVVFDPVAGESKQEQVDDGIEKGFHRSGMRLVLHSGETLTKARLDSPWVPDVTQSKQCRGQSRLAIQISGSAELRREAMEAYDALV